ncbi:hypothetical protein [Streptacidiphilus sp. EB103A]|uniref:hypothetical protein n=1 Tax=Streptacidiphilus sp. EB103A TaxID=3156275 RepID=UPI0035161F97
MPETVDPLECVEQCHLSTVQARRRAEFNAALDHNQAALAALPADGTLTGAEHNEWLQRLVAERALILDTAAQRRRSVERERVEATRENAWAARYRWSSRRVPRAYRHARGLLICTTVVCCLAVAVAEFAVRAALS